MEHNDTPVELSEKGQQFSHKFHLTPPYEITGISSALCSLLGYSKSEIRRKFHNQYISLIAEEDRELYRSFLASLAAQETTLHLHYRLNAKDGRIISVSDTSFSHKKQDGNLYGFSLLATIAEEQTPMYNLPDSAAPFGYLQCSCEKYPRVLYINDRMLSVLGGSAQGGDWQDFLRDNIYFMIPIEDRDKFRDYLTLAENSQESIPISHKILQSDGELRVVRGWLGTVRHSTGRKDFSIIYTDLNCAADNESGLAGNSYFRALESAYNIIFEINTTRKTVECIFGKDTSDMGKLFGVRMTIDSAVEFWVNNYIVPEDRKKMLHYFRQILLPDALTQHPLQTEFRIQWEDQEVYSFIGVAIPHEVGSILFCCRDTAKVQFSSLQAREIRAFRRFQTFVDQYLQSKRGLSGILIFESTDSDHCIPIYASKGLLQFASLRNDQYIHILDEGFSLKKLAEAGTKNGVKDFDRLLSGQLAGTECSYNGKQYTVTCERLFESVYMISVCSSGLPAVVAGIPQKGIFARTFGHFDLFIDGRPVVFSNSREKELLALLIDRNGGTVTSSEAIAYLWENDTPDEKLKVRFRKLAMGLRQTLEHCGAEHILINRNGVRSIDTSAITCDYYELLSGNVEYCQSFHNSYMVDYSWAEATLATLWDFS